MLVTLPSETLQRLSTATPGSAPHGPSHAGLPFAPHTPQAGPPDLGPQDPLT